MDHILAIFDSEKRYVKKLAGFLENRIQMPFHILAFDNLEKLAKFFSGNRATVLLINKKEWQPSLEDLAEQIILLTDEKMEERLEADPAGQGFPAVCKYQSAEAIAKKVLGICAVVKTPILTVYPGECSQKEKAEIVGIYTPVGRCLQTSFAMVYSRLRAKSKKTLYINFEVFSGFGAWFEREYSTDLMDLMYFLDEPEDKFLFKLAGITEHFGGTDYIPPAISYEDFMMVKAEEWIKLIKMIAQKSEYEVIVLDLGDQMQGLFEILSLCDKLYAITRSDGIAKAKIESFEKALKMSHKEELLQRIVKCRLPVFKEIPQKAEELGYSQLADYMKNKLGEVF